MNYLTIFNIGLINLTIAYDTFVMTIKMQGKLSN